MSDAELVITPEVSKKALKKMMSDLDKGMKLVADDTQKYFEEAFEDAGKKGGKKAGKGLAKGLKAGLKGGLKGVAIAVAGSLVSGYAIAAAQRESAEGSVVGLLGERDASTNLAFSTGQGMTTAQFSALNARVNRAGGDDQMTRDFTVDTSEFIAQGRKGENDLLANFSQYKGSDQFNAVLASLAGRDADDVNKFLADIGWAGDAGVIFNMLDELGGKTGNEAFTTLQNITEKDKERAEMLEKEAKLEGDFADITRRANVNVKTGLLENVDSGFLTLYEEGLRAKGQDEINAVKNYKANAALILEVEQKKRELDAVMLKVFNWLWDMTEPLGKMIKFLIAFYTPKKITDAEAKRLNQSAKDKVETFSKQGADTSGDYLKDLGF
jgi:hypothetical protein